MKNKLTRSLVIGLGLFPAAVWAQSVALTQDSYVVPGAAANFGSAVSINVGGANADQGLVQFDLSTLPVISGNGVAKASLLLFVNKLGASGSVNVSVANGLWTEGGVTGLNAPVTGAVVASGVSITTPGVYIAVDATQAVKNWLDNIAPNRGFIITPGDANVSVFFDSKESTTTSHPAILSISPTGPAGPTGPSGTVGAAGPTGPAGANGATGAAGPSGPVGPTGVAGSNGQNGSPGAAGATGPTGATGVVNVSSQSNGSWNEGNSYVAGDVAGFNSAAYIALKANSGVAPGTDPNTWALLGQVGPTGPLGPSGPAGSDGAAGPTGPAGSNGASGPTGAAGVNGASGPTGPAGANGSSGPTGPQGVTGSAGPAGPSGPSGPAGSVAAGATTDTWLALATSQALAAWYMSISGSATLNPSGGVTESSIEIPVPASCKIDRMDVRIAVIGATAYNATLTLFKNGATTGFSCTPASATSAAVNAVTSNSCTLSGGSVISVSAGDTLGYSVSGATASSNARVGTGLHCQ